jgi:hypothetical protein
MFQRVSALLIVLSAAMSVTACSSDAATNTATTGNHAHYAAAGPDKPNADGQIAPRLQNLGAYAFPVSTKSELAQKFINQGLNL